VTAALSGTGPVLPLTSANRAGRRGRIPLGNRDTRQATFFVRLGELPTSYAPPISSLPLRKTVTRRTDGPDEICQTW
jgi:hypothetical protein